MWAVRFEDVSKRYRHGGPRYPSLRHDIGEFGRRLGASFRRQRAEPRGTLALDRVSFQISEGESFAIIGPNGAGKSTALRLLSRISYPTGGRVRVRGRVGALIEVGSGVHPELTGRENVWLYGNILGIARRQIARCFDDVVAFAELEQAIDTQVKYYSSGMQLRLGFSIASFLEPDVFVVDEALAVGDASFQAKCVERMAHMVRSGRTLIFVSHALPLVQELCESALLLEQGRAIEFGRAPTVVSNYVERLGRTIGGTPTRGDVVSVRSMSVRSARAGNYRIATGDAVVICIGLEVEREVGDAVVAVAISDGRPGSVMSMTTLSKSEDVPLRCGFHQLTCEVPSLPLLPGSYEVWAGITSRTKAAHALHPRVVGTLMVVEGPAGRHLDALLGSGGGLGPVHVDYQLRIEPCEEATQPTRA